ncbi:MAG: hypothetical protein K6G64_06655 [Eubacterium sp.]|nr:hypothetical protein [Eubacterium sp.]
MKKKTFLLFTTLIFIFSFFICDTNDVQAKTSVNKVVKYARKVYYGTNQSIARKKLKKVQDNNVESYFDKQGHLRKSIIPKGSTDPASIKGYTVEYYYSKDMRLVFAFAYKNVRGKTYEHRAYYGKNGKLYRYISANKKIKNYKKGHNPYSAKDSSIIKKMYLNGTMNLHWYGLI